MSQDLINRFIDLNSRMLDMVGYLIIKHGVNQELKSLELWLNKDYERLLRLKGEKVQ